MHRLIAPLLLLACSPPPTCAITSPAPGSWLRPGEVLLEMQVAVDPRTTWTVQVAGDTREVAPEPDGTLTQALSLAAGDVDVALVGRAGGQERCRAEATLAVREVVPLVLRAPVAGEIYSGPVPVEGLAGPGAALVVSGDASAALSAGPDGAFSTTVSLAPGLHQLAVSATQVPEGFEDRVEVTLRVDAPPSPPTLALPANPTREAPLVADVVTPPLDLDGDAITLRWSWSLDGVEQPDLITPEVPADRLTRGQRWRVTAVPHDGYINGEAATAETTVTNALPSASDAQVRVGPNGASCSWTWLDADGDADQSAVRWLVDGAVAGVGPTLDVSALPPSTVVTCEITPFDGLDAGAPTTASAATSRAAPNVLVVVLDDVGAYELALYDPAATFHTPVIDQLAAEGLTFNRVWSMPLCAPSRGAALTGRYPLRTGFGDNIQVDQANVTLPNAELSWAEQVRATAPESRFIGALGKWHLTSHPDGGGANVLAQGFDTYLGVLGNLYDNQSLDGLASDYFTYEKTRDTLTAREFGYLLLDEVDDAIALATGLSQPWTMWVALHAAHEPFHEPPVEVLPYGPTFIPDIGQRALFGHMIEAADAELGRLLAAVPPDTHVIVIGDNGSPARVGPGDRPDSRLKGSVYEGGVRVPMVVRSPLITTPGVRTDALVSFTDLFPTIVELSRGNVSGVDLDGHSLLPLLTDPGAVVHDVVYTEHFEPAGFGPYAVYDRAIRDADYKLVRQLDAADRLYLLGDDLREGTNLLDAPLTPQDLAAYDRLSERLDRNDLR